MGIPENKGYFTVWPNKKKSVIERYVGTEMEFMEYQLQKN